MQELLYLTHRIPYPPNKGDKIRSYHVLQYLSQHYHVHLGTFIDDAEDWKHLDKIKDLCGETCFINLNPRIARIRSLSGLFTNSPLTLSYYGNKELRAWVNTQLETRSIDKIVIFSSAMAQYVRDAQSVLRIIDFVDIDSDKWKQYARTKSWPFNWIYQRESNVLLNYEKQITREFNSATFVSEREAALFKQLVPEIADKVSYFNNGVDTDYFSPQNKHPNPYLNDTRVLVFTGAMDYWANIDAVTWFAHHVFPVIYSRFPRIQFYIVGSRPTNQVKALAAIPGIIVTGSVVDVRPYLIHASLAVAPLRIARGVQNKVLEAMAMGKTVIASPQAMEGIHALPGRELYVAGDENEFIRQIMILLTGEIDAAMGCAARMRVLADYSWSKNLARIDELLVQSLEVPVA
ncbi:sugar transferase, PEP-CTERM/EpsH1 system associated [Nitrosomonas cryotolerans]|uniref:Sugar transferase, PEP-CTERM/EpsH1 system associated n=1 Tax=Nitrosomonas cryotolerans ATCC 49181 TaxID=1131553 RepID=A0A1N6J7K7_9PROT|nr:TIGR03087 family PEP-CTERM/XrtA system glycosyltransferase [Nitrosomonas cryotolerans]SFP44951.1 sugar transferase, PEP-CTERM/EpsH1 system associated [Nitrosomonas cryotolerans]SIO40223.1 sugar transferase, PEP-CTERM/EpsH1 system associated [Nitrosomonas cryotolerans ATCC 49181]